MIKEKEEIYDLKRERMLEYEKLKAGRVKFVSEFSEEDKHIARFLFLRRELHPNIKENYYSVKLLIIKILKSLDYDDEYIKKYIKRYDIRLIFLKTPEEIFSRLAVLNMAGINEREAFLKPRILYVYNEDMIYDSVKELVNSGEEYINIDTIINFIKNKKDGFESKGSTKLVLAYMGKCYKNKCNF